MSKFLGTFALLVAITGVIVAPVFAQSSVKTSKTAKTSKSKSVKTASTGKMYICDHCKVPTTEAAAKKQGMTCCSMKMHEIKSAKATKPAAGKKS